MNRKVANKHRVLYPKSVYDFALIVDKVGAMCAFA